MICPYCNHPHSEVTNKRPSTLNQIEGVRRRHECLSCHQRFSTFEYICEIPRGNVPRNVFHPGYDPVAYNSKKNERRGIVGAKNGISRQGNSKVKRNLGDEVKQALIRAKQRYARELDELDASEFDEEDFD